jgi:hypothetical protein
VAYTSTRGTPAVPSPFSAEWRSTVLQDLAARAAAGEDPDALRAELLEHLWPWAQRLADREARRLPAGSDRDDTRSHVLAAMWQATRQIDWDRWDTWPALLLRRVRGARIDAARSDDVVSRRDRGVLNRIDTEVVTSERERGRTLTAAEQDEIRERVLAALTPRRRRALAGAVTGPPVLVDTFATNVVDDRWDPEARTLEADRAQHLGCWLRHDLPPELREHLLDWLAQQKQGSVVPARLRARLLPYLPSLLERVEGQPLPGIAAVGR